jgi:hypothetical protein
MSGGTPMTPPPPPPPPPPPLSTTTPIDLAGTANGFALTLTWRNPVGAGTPSSVLLDVTGPVVTTIPLGLTDRFSYPNVPAGTYTFSVRAVSAQGVSAPSTAVTLSFPGTGTSTSASPSSSACGAVPEMPLNLQWNRSGALVSLTWQPAASGPPAASYLVSVTGSYVGSFTTVAPSLAGTVGPGTYVVRVQSVNACGASAPAPPVTISIQ